MASAGGGEGAGARRQVDIESLLAGRKRRLRRMANQRGASGERLILSAHGYQNLVPRPSGPAMTAILKALEMEGTKIKRTSFDAILLRPDAKPDFSTIESAAAAIEGAIFLEIKATTRANVADDFTGFFFAVTEGEMQAAERLGRRHRVVLYNQLTGKTLETTVSDILARAKSATWQLSVQL